MIDANVIKALSGLFSALSDLSNEQLGSFVRLAVKLLRLRDGHALTENDVKLLLNIICVRDGTEEEPQEEATSDIPVDALPPKVDFDLSGEEAVIINVTCHPRVKQSILVHFKPASEEASKGGECAQECCCTNQEMVYEEVTGNMDNVRPAGKDDAQEQERLKACARVAAFIRDNCKASHLEIWQRMQNEGLSTVRDVRDIGMHLKDHLRNIYIRNSLIYFIEMKTLLENGQARFLESRSKDGAVRWRVRGDDGNECNSFVAMSGFEQGSLFMVTYCATLLPEYISVKLRRVMCENYDAIMEDVYAMCARLSKADTFNAVPITKDEFNTLRNLVL